MKLATKVPLRDPHISCVLFGANPAWTPDDEPTKKPRRCRRCGGSKGVIQPGDPIYCASCGRTGYERSLRLKREATPEPEPEAKPESAVGPKIEIVLSRRQFERMNDEELSWIAEHAKLTVSDEEQVP